jgi:hypothetical protein
LVGLLDWHFGWLDALQLSARSTDLGELKTAIDKASGQGGRQMCHYPRLLLFASVVNT